MVRNPAENDTALEREHDVSVMFQNEKLILKVVVRNIFNVLRFSIKL